MKPLLFFVALLSSITGVTFAHHGLEGYDTSKAITIEGRVTEFRLMDPHSMLVVEAESPDGTLTVWEIEGGAGSGIVSSGLSREFLSSGPRVRVELFQSRDSLCNLRCSASGQDFTFYGI